MGNFGLPSIDFIFSASTGIFSVIVVIFFCFKIKLKVPSGFSIASSVGFSKSIFTVLFSIVCPGIITIVFSSFLWDFSKFCSWFISLGILFPWFLFKLLFLSKFFKTFWFWGSWFKFWDCSFFVLPGDIIFEISFLGMTLFCDKVFWSGLFCLFKAWFCLLLY